MTNTPLMHFTIGCNPYIRFVHLNRVVLIVRCQKNSTNITGSLNDHFGIKEHGSMHKQDKYMNHARSAEINGHNAQQIAIRQHLTIGTNAYSTSHGEYEAKNVISE
jgi:hypothetical protein